MEFRSVTHAAKNEAGLEQIEIEVKRGIWSRLFLGHRRIMVFERWPTGWRNQQTGEYATAQQRLVIAQALHWKLLCR